MRIGIAGAGIAGRLIAWQLGRLGHEVDVFDPAPDAEAPSAPGTHGAAAFTAAGMLSPLGELENAPGDVAERGWRSLDLWPGIVAELRPELRATTLFRRNGSVLVAHPGDAGAAERVLARVRAAQIKSARVRDAVDSEQGMPPSPRQPDGDGPAPSSLPRGGDFPLDELAERSHRRLPTLLADEALRTLEPTLSAGLRGWLLPGEGQIDTARLLPALCADAVGVRWHWATRVDRVEAHQLHFAHARSRGFEVAIDTRGLGSRPALPLRGVRGELLWLHAPGLDLRRPIRCVHPRHRVYLVPRHGDIVIVGATEVDSEDRSTVSVRSAIELLTAAHSIVPQLAEARIVRLETHLRPATADQRPLLQVDQGLIRINGLFRHGFLLAPAMVEEALLRSGLAAGVALRRETSDA
ncbi:MAG: FAD-dependent oxidoreductase [Burkholderiaceae bacterium]